MTDQWERASESFQRATVDLGFAESIDVYTQSETYIPGEGTTWTESAFGSNPIDAETAPPEDDTDRDPGGTTAEADIVLYVPDDQGVTWVEYGTESEGATQFEVKATGTRYRVESVATEYNGHDKIMGVEL